MGKIHIRIPAMAAVLLVALSACGSSGQGNGSSTSGVGSSSGSTATNSPSSGSSSAMPSTSSAGPTSGSSAGSTGSGHSDLTIEIRETPGGAPTNYVLVCDGVSPGSSSTVDDAAAACAALDKYGPAAFAPATLGSRRCTAQYASSRVATVKGTFHGSSVNATFSQTDGCQIATWNSLAPLFGGKAGVL